MGNKIARTTQASSTEYYLHDLPSSYNLVLKEVLGRARFLKSIQCKHDEGLVLVKVYFKRGDSIDLREYERKLARIREVFSRIENPHVWPFQYTALSSASLRRNGWRFSLKNSVLANGNMHGDIKCENVLVTSWNWLYLADFASFKPTYIPHDDPSDFSFFFDTGGRRRCYLAPERFYEHGGEIQVAHDAPLRPSMDIFAVGCVIAKLFLEGQPLFELSQLLAYRRGQYDPNQHLEKTDVKPPMLGEDDCCRTENFRQMLKDRSVSTIAMDSGNVRVLVQTISDVFKQKPSSILREITMNASAKESAVLLLKSWLLYIDDGKKMIGCKGTSIRNLPMPFDSSAIVRSAALETNSNIRRALLQDVGNIAGSLVRDNVMTSYWAYPFLHFFNDQDELLDLLFYRQLIYVCFFVVSGKLFEEYLRNISRTGISDDMYQKGAENWFSMRVETDRRSDLQVHKVYFTSTMQSFSLGDNDVEARLRTMGSFVHTAYGSVDITDPSFSDKLKFFGFMSPQISGANSLIGDKSSKAEL
ncbi:armadillo-like helical domain-containing protein [Tanacetum coccineum]